MSINNQCAVTILVPSLDTTCQSTCGNRTHPQSKRNTVFNVKLKKKCHQ